MICTAEILKVPRINPPFLALKDGPATSNLDLSDSVCYRKAETCEKLLHRLHWGVHGVAEVFPVVPTVFLILNL